MFPEGHVYKNGSLVDTIPNRHGREYQRQEVHTLLRLQCPEPRLHCASIISSKEARTL